MNYKLALSCLLFVWTGTALTHTSRAQLFSGKIENLNNPELAISTLRDYVFWQTDTVYADQEGNFSIMLQLKSPGYIRLWASNFRNETIYMLPGTSLHIEADGSDSPTFWNTQRFSGSAALYNNYTADISRNEYLKSLGYNAKTYQLPEAQFVEFIRNHHDTRDSLRADYFRQNTSHGRPENEINDFRTIDSIHSSYQKVSAYRSYIQFLPKEEQNRFYTAYIEPFARNQQDDWRYLSSSNYRWFFATYLRRKFDSQNETRKENGLETWPYHYYYEQAPGLMEQYLIEPLRRYVSEVLLENISMDYPVVNDTLLSSFNHYTTLLYNILDHPQREKLYREKFSGLRDFRNRTAIGQPAFAFELQDSVGRTVNLDQFKGKILYIDLWASWCGPCIAQFPAGHKLEEEFAGENRLAFLSVSLDDLERDWKSGRTQHHPPGQQFWIKGGMKSDFVKDYGINGIPHYLLIDEKGNFIAYRAPRPGDPAIREALQKALENSKPGEK